MRLALSYTSSGSPVSGVAGATRTADEENPYNWKASKQMLFSEAESVVESAFGIVREGSVVRTVYLYVECDE